MKKVIKLLFSTCMLFMLVGGCSSKSDNEYITFTVTVQEENDDTKFYSENYYFNMKDEKIVKTVTVPFTSQYPLTAYDRVNNAVYYTYRIEGEKTDQIYAYHLDTKETEKLTDDIWAVNDIVPMGDTFLFTGEQIYSKIHGIKPYVYDVKEKSYHLLDSWDANEHISSLNYIPSKDELLVTGFPLNKEIQNAQENITDFDTKTLNSIYIIKGSETKKVFELEDELSNVFGNEEIIAFKKNNAGSYFIKHTRELEKDMEIYDFVPYHHHMIGYSSDNRFIYYLDQKTLYKYDTKNQKTEALFTSKNKISFINNAIILK